ncbi:MAG: SdiA-regulated domain-containing protein [Pseudomonadota bacterium]
MLENNQKLPNKLFVAAFFIVLCVLILSLTELDDKVWYFFHDMTISQEVEERSIWLPEYHANLVGLPIPGIDKNASGMTFNRDTNTLWVIVNSPTYLVELDLAFNLLRRIDMKNFKDTEAITYIGNDEYLLTDERDQSITLAKIDTQTTALDKNNLEKIVLNFHGYSNKGLEGIAVDYLTNTIYAVRERDPMVLMKITGFIENNNRIQIEKYDQINIDGLYMDDLSGLHFDVNSGHLLFLSDESKLLAEIDLEGKKISYMDLEKGFNNLKQSIPQAEGVVLDDEGHLYIVSEPNLLYRYEKKGE